VTTCLENLEILGNLTAVREMSEKKSCHKNVYCRGDYFSGKPGNVSEFDSCQGQVRDLIKSWEDVRNCGGKDLVGENCSLLTSCLGNTNVY